MTIQFPYEPAIIEPDTVLYPDMWNIPGAQIAGLTDRIGGSWTNRTRPRSPEALAVHPIGWNIDRGYFEYWNGRAWVQAFEKKESVTVLDGEYTCPEEVQVGDAVAKDSNNNSVVLADGNDKILWVHGFCREKLTSTTCTVQTAGELDGFTGFTPSEVYFLSRTLGRITLPPLDFGLPGVIQSIGVAKSDTVLDIRIDRPYTVK